MFYQLFVLAQEQTPQPPPPNMWEMLRGMWFIPVIFLIMYFLIIHPQRKKDKERNELRKNLKKNDKVVTIGGIRGVVKSIAEDEVVLLVDETKDVKIKLSRQSILTVEERSGQEESEK